MGETTSNPFQFKLGAQTHVGCVRTNNEDNFIVSADLASGEWLLPRSQNLFTLGAKGAVLVVFEKQYYGLLKKISRVGRRRY